MDHRSRRFWANRARLLILSTLGYNLVEAGVAVGSGVAAGSIALVGFGLDSAIEIAAGIAAWWRIRAELEGDDARTPRAEAVARRAIGVTFLLLAGYIAYEAVCSLAGGERPEQSLVGIFLAALSLLVMPLLARAKLRAAAALGSRALRAEAHETLACAYLSMTLLLGLLLNALAGWWWADPVAAALMVPWLAKEGWETLSDGEEDEEEEQQEPESALGRGDSARGGTTGRAI